MWTASDVTRFLREELDYPRLVVRLTPYRPEADRRWEVCEIRRRLFGPFEAAGMRFKEMRDYLDPFYVHEGPHGEYLSLDRNAILAAVLEQDTHKGARPAKMVARIEAAKARRHKAQAQMFEDIAMDSRSTMVKVADEMGL